MDFEKALRELYAERQRLTRMIELCEAKIDEQQRLFGLRRRRNLSDEQRRAASERMKRYWENRRATS